jgi:hypothetical protein
VTDPQGDFQGCEVVRLRKDSRGEDLNAGDCGIVWGVYGSGPTLYEATFVDQSGVMVDKMFYEDEVDELQDVKEAPFPEVLERIVKMFDAAARHWSKDPNQE